MRISSFDSYVESGAEVLKHLKNYRKIAEKIKEMARRRCGSARVMVFGSVVEGRITALSDIDVLIICDLDEEERVKLKAEIRRGARIRCPRRAPHSVRRGVQEME